MRQAAVGLYGAELAVKAVCAMSLCEVVEVPLSQGGRNHDRLCESHRNAAFENLFCDLYTLAGGKAISTTTGPIRPEGYSGVSELNL